MTDANLLLGRLEEAIFLGAAFHLDRERAMRMLLAEGVVRYSGGVCGGDSSRDDTEMEKAIRVGLCRARA